VAKYDVVLPRHHHPTGGPCTLLRLLRQELPGVPGPARSTIAFIRGTMKSAASVTPGASAGTASGWMSVRRSGASTSAWSRSTTTVGRILRTAPLGRFHEDTLRIADALGRQHRRPTATALLRGCAHHGQAGL